MFFPFQLYPSFPINSPSGALMSKHTLTQCPVINPKLVQQRNVNGFFWLGAHFYLIACKCMTYPGLSTRAHIIVHRVPRDILW